MSAPRFQDLACPSCGQRQGFLVDVTAVAFLDAGGAKVESDYGWDRSSTCVCPQCNTEGTVTTFMACLGNNP